MTFYNLIFALATIAITNALDDLMTLRLRPSVAIGLPQVNKTTADKNDEMTKMTLRLRPSVAIGLPQVNKTTADKNDE